MESFIAKKALYGPPKVGGDTLAYCTRCKMDLAHVVISMVDGRPVKVICKTCQSPHRYKLSGDVSAKKTSGATPRVSTPRSVVRLAEIWEKKISESNSIPQDYKPTGKFAKGDLLKHVKFGIGIVEEVKLGGKISVLFRDEERVLIHQMGAHSPK